MDRPRTKYLSSSWKSTAGSSQIPRLRVCSSFSTSLESFWSSRAFILNGRMFSYSNTSLFEYCRPLDEEVQRVQGAADCVPILLKAVGLRFEEELLKGAV